MIYLNKNLVYNLRSAGKNDVLFLFTQLFLYWCKHGSDVEEVFIIYLTEWGDNRSY